MSALPGLSTHLSLVCKPQLGLHMLWEMGSVSPSHPSWGPRQGGKGSVCITSIALGAWKLFQVLPSYFTRP